MVAASLGSELFYSLSLAWSTTVVVHTLIIAGEKSDGGKDRGGKGQGGNLDAFRAPLVLSENMSKIHFL